MAPAPVVIAGAGPVGLTLALELARHDVPTVVVDRKPHLAHEGSRAIVIARHTLETFRRLDCAEPMLAKAVTIARARTFFRETELFSVEFPSTRASELPAFVNLQQTYTEHTLYECVERSPSVEVRWSSEVVGVEQDGNGVDVALDTGSVRASFLVGCDGAASAVRKLAGIDFAGRTFRDRFLIADVRAQLPFQNERRFYFDPPFNRGRQVLIHQQPDDEWRIDWQVPVETDAERERASGALDERIRRVIGGAPYELVWLTSYRFHERIARRFRVGRVLLAGDAAHLMAPFGARGLNSGVEDARNLGWKLAFVLAGAARESLLDTYESERAAAARENVRITSATMRFMAPPTLLHRTLRNAVLRASLHSARARRLVNSGRLATPAVYAGDGLVGRLAPGGVQPLLARGFTVLCFTASAESERRVAEAAETAGVVSVWRRPGTGDPPTGVTRTSDDGTLSREYGVDGSEALFVIRPDGYVAAALDSVDPAWLASALRAACHPRQS